MSYSLMEEYRAHWLESDYYVEANSSIGRALITSLMALNSIENNTFLSF